MRAPGRPPVDRLLTALWLEHWKVSQFEACDPEVSNFQSKIQTLARDEMWREGSCALWAVNFLTLNRFLLSPMTEWKTACSRCGSPMSVFDERCLHTANIQIYNRSEVKNQLDCSDRKKKFCAEKLDQDYKAGPVLVIH